MVRSVAYLAFVVAVTFASIAEACECAPPPAEACDAASDGTPVTDSEGWSKAVRDIEARIALIEKPRINGTRTLVPYLELRNVGSSAYPIQVRCNSDHVTFELVDADGNAIRDGITLPRSGPHAEPGTVSLPHDSSIRIGMYCSNWGVPRDAAAMISTDSGAWVLTSEEKGKVFLRATIQGNKLDSDPNRTWYGKIQTPLIQVDWSE
jgi:hypothetical protein